jgi:haloacetate dehalogenase
MWHKTAPALSKYFTVVVGDLRGYGNSPVLSGGKNHINYSKREMAKDMVQLMDKLNFKKFLLQDMIGAEE